MVMPLGKLGGLRPLGREPSRAGMVGNLGRVPGIWTTEGNAAADGDEEDEEVEEVSD